jgi:hypothetical protein
MPKPPSYKQKQMNPSLVVAAYQRLDAKTTVLQTIILNQAKRE